MQNKPENIKKTYKHNTTLVISVSIFVGLLIFILIITSAGFLFLKYLDQQKTKSLSNAQKWQQTLSGLDDEPIVTVPSEEQDERKQNIGKIGQTISNEILDIQVSSIEKVSLKSSQPSKDSEFYKIDFSIKNNTDKDQKISTLNIIAKDSNDGEFSLVIPSQSDNQSVFEEEIALTPGQKKNNSIIYEINKNVKDIDFVFDDDANTKILIKLAK
ncbi:MAG: DUF4352 domain-containing protein [Patescibacteria group bacterium]|nr:DUF4352 domain-containing protein [Patescibacteria group bacterium]